jgi:hypothetical protein
MSGKTEGYEFVSSLDMNECQVNGALGWKVLALQKTCETNAKSVRVSQGEVPQAVIPIAD